MRPRFAAARCSRSTSRATELLILLQLLVVGAQRVSHAALSRPTVFRLTGRRVLHGDERVEPPCQRATQQRCVALGSPCPFDAEPNPVLLAVRQIGQVVILQVQTRSKDAARVVRHPARRTLAERPRGSLQTRSAGWLLPAQSDPELGSSARELADEVVKYLSPEQKAKAERLAREFEPKTAAADP